MRLLRNVAALAALTCTIGIQAQTIKPGLWEITTQMQGPAGGQIAGAMSEMQKQMDSMPPEQRKMMQDMMAKQGVQLGATGNGGLAVKMCMTQEMVDRSEFGGHQGDCTHTSSARMGNTQKYSFTCTKPPSSGEGQVTFNGREAYTMQMSVTSTIKGKPEKMDMQGAGKWLGSDCGAIKPLAMPKK
jgi:hypothetical protein